MIDKPLYLRSYIQMTKAVLGQNPRFRLRGIDPLDLQRRYEAGEYATIVVPSSKVKPVLTKVNIVARTFGSTQDSPIYQLKDRNGKNILMATTNSQAYEMYTLKGQSLPTSGRCFWCLQDYHHEATLAPIAYRRDTTLTVKPDSSNGHQSKIEYKYVFWGESYFCDFECMYAWCRLFMSIPPHVRDPSYRDACATALLMYNLIYPEGPELIEAQDFRLIEENGGSIPYTEFKSGRHVWRRCPNVIVAPAKVPYQQIS